MQARQLQPAVHEKIWGSEDTSPWISSGGRRVGEVWFEPTLFPLLLKFLFTSEALSVQVHPDDAQAARSGFARGKTEMWYVLRAAPGATVALGLKAEFAGRDLAQAAGSADLLDWIQPYPVAPGDVCFVPAGTVHALGAGIAIFEIQQHSDVTYRMYDYGRGRALHAAEGVAVSVSETHPGPFAAAPGARALLVDCPYFRTERMSLDAGAQIADAGPRVYSAVAGSGRICGLQFSAGSVIECGEPGVIETGSGCVLLRISAGPA